MKNNQYFWIWFTDNEKQIRSLRSLSPKMQKFFTYWLDWHLHFYSPGIDYILIFPERGEAKAELVLTANGDPEFFGRVEKLVAEAPSLKPWKITAFVQPAYEYEQLEAGLDKPYVMGEITLKLSDLSFVPFEEESGKSDLIVYLPRFTMYLHKDSLQQLIYIMLQDLLGEKMLYQNINFVHLAQAPDNADFEAIRLYELQFYLDDLNSTER